MQSVAETPTFTRQAEKLFSDDEKMELVSFLSIHPLAGDEDLPLYGLLAYPKNAKVDLTPAEKGGVAAFVDAIKAERSRK